MITQFSTVWDKKAKAWGTVRGSYPLDEHYNEEAKFFSVSALPLSMESSKKVNVKNLQVLSQSDWVEVELVGGEQKTYFVRITDFIGDWSTAKPAPKGYTAPEFQVGDLVSLVLSPHRWAVVKQVFPDRIEYALETFLSRDYERLLESGVSVDQTAPKTTTANLLTKVDLPAPQGIRSARERQQIRDNFKWNINSGNSQYFAYHNVYAKRNHQTRGKLLAKVIAEAKNDKYDTLNGSKYEIKEVLNSLTRKNQNLVWRLIEDVNTQNDIFCECGECGQIEVYDDVKYSEWHDTSFCGACEDRFVYSGIMDSYIRENEACPYYESVRAYRNEDADDWVVSSWAMGNLHVYELNHEGVFFDESTYDEVCDQYDDDDDDDDEQDRDGLEAYHDSNRNWVEQWENKSYLPLGLEVEVYSEDRREAVMAVRNAFSDMYLERDGSIDDDYGFEVITQPYGKDEWAKHGKKLLNILKDYSACAYNSPAGRGYGIHININRSYLSPLQEMRMFMFLAANENGDFVKAIAQRANIFNAEVAIGAITECNQKVSNAGGLTAMCLGRRDPRGADIYNKKINGRGKYAPINMHYDRMEIRIFQSTLNGTSFNKNLEFTWALIEWTSTKVATGHSWAHVDFVKWLAKRPHAEKDYPSLVAFLRKDTYALIDCAAPIANTWKEFIPKETRRSVLQLVVNAFDEEEVETEVAVPIAA